MNKYNLKKLEFDQVLQKLSEYSHTYIGKEKVFKLEPSSDKDYVKNSNQWEENNFETDDKNKKEKDKNDKKK